MKRAAILLSLLVFLLLAACGRAAPAETPAPAPEVTAAPGKTPEPAETPEPAATPEPPPPPPPFEVPETLTLPRLTLASGGKETEALLDTAHWTYRNSKGEDVSADKIPASQTGNYRDMDWYSLEWPILRADGAVSLSFSMGEPKNPKLSAFTSLGMVPVALEDWTFLPYAGVNTYVLTCTWDWTKEEGGGSCSFILLVEGAETNAPAGTEREDLRLTITSADRYGCAFTLENLGTRWPYKAEAMTDRGDPFALLRRTEAGGWEWVKPIRTFQGGYAANLESGESWSWAWDWSYSYGCLPPGDYALMLCGYTRNQGAGKETLYLRSCFTLTDAERRVPGPLTLCPMPEGIEAAMEMRSEHRWVQTLSTEAEGWMAEYDFSLFRLTEDGELEYIPPEFHLPYGLNYPYWLLNGGSRDYDVDLAAQYGQLPAGTYVLRRRFLLRTEEERNYDAADRLWPLWPEDRVVFGDTVFTLNISLWDVPREVDPVDEWYHLYTGEETNLLISTAGSVFDSQKATLRLTNADANQWYMVGYESDYYYLYFNYLGEWFPVAGKRYRSHGGIWGHVKPGESQELGINFTLWYGELPAGTYRLVLNAGTWWADSAQEEPLRIVSQFVIHGDGSGEWQGLEEAEALVDTYSRELAAKYRYEPEGDWFLSPGPIWSRDPAVMRWALERQRDTLTVTVYRDRDLERAEALLGSYPNVEIIRARDFTTPSPVRESNTRTDLVLTARVIEQEDPALEPAGTWLLSLTWKGEETLELYPDPFYAIYLEEYDPEGDQWLRLPDFGWGRIGPLWMYTVPLEPGQTVNIYNLNLGWYQEDLSRDKQYRFALHMDTQPGSEVTLEYVLCPFRLEQYDKAASEEEIAALGESYPIMDDYVFNETNFLGKPLADYFDVTMRFENEDFLFFYAEAEYLGEGTSGESDIHEALRFQLRDIICGNVESIASIPWDYRKEGGVTVCYSTEAENWGDTRTLPEFREGDKYILCLALPREGKTIREDYPNALFLLGDGEVYYVTEGDLIMPTQYFRAEYAGYSRLTFRRLLQDLYADTME